MALAHHGVGRPSSRRLNHELLIPRDHSHLHDAKRDDEQDREHEGELHGRAPPAFPRRTGRAKMPHGD